MLIALSDDVPLKRKTRLRLSDKVWSPKILTYEQFLEMTTQLEIHLQNVQTIFTTMQQQEPRKDNKIHFRLC